MPEPNTPWYAWSGTKNGNTPDEYVLAWQHVRKVVRLAAGPRVSFLWSPYVRSIPETTENGIDKYFPGSAYVDFVGVSGYNFGATGGLTWADPATLFVPAYTAIQKLSPKPFWITETGSTATGGSKTAWITALRSLKTSMPKLRGIVWFDVADPQGDFRLAGPALKSAKTLLKGRCIV
jgi:beta-mannanase